MSKIKELFTEKFRPKELNQLIIPDRIRGELKEGLIQNILLAGPPGTGKTSLAYIMAKDHQRYYINASADARMEIIEPINEFCAAVSLSGDKDKLKVVILDEIDGASEAFFKALRPIIERYHKTTRFILTCNYIQKIPDPIISRMNVLDIYPKNKEEEQYIFRCYLKRTAGVLKSINVTYTEETLTKFVQSGRGDMRMLMNKLQSLYNRGLTELTMDALFSSNTYRPLYDICMSNNSTSGKNFENYKLIAGEYSSKIDECMTALGTDFIDYLKETNKPKYDAKLAQLIISVAEYQHILSQGPIDPMITLLACVAKIQIILNS